MKVEQHGPGTPAGRTEHTPAVGEAPTGGRSTATSASSDTVSLSSDVEFVRKALEQAQAQPEIRTEVVQRMRELMERGELGADAGKLADAMIDRWLTTP